MKHARIRLSLFGCILVLMIACAALTAWAEDVAQDITAQCNFALQTTAQDPDAMFTDDLKTFAYTNGDELGFIDIETPADAPAYGLYIVWANPPGPYEILTPNPAWFDDEFRSIDDPLSPPPYLFEQKAGQDGFVHEYVPLNGLTKFRIQRRYITPEPFGIARIHVLGQGALPDFVQTWEPAPDRADLMVVATHPDDELLFFGGLIPYYAGERQMSTVVVYATYGTRERRSELLNALWLCGVRTYPVLGTFVDWGAPSMDYTTAFMNPDDVSAFLTEQIRRFRPLVVVGQDLEGEYGHGAHKVVANQLLGAVRDKVWDESEHPESAQKYGVCEVPKLYLHLYEPDDLRMDWETPLPFFGGKTAIQVASDAFAQHISQQDPMWDIFDMQNLDNHRFGLVHTLVDYDEQKNDLFEHIDQWEEPAP